MEELNEQVQIVRSNTVNSKSKSVYLYGIVKYILWLHANKPDIVDPSLRILLSSVVAEDDDEAYKQKQQDVQSPVNPLVAEVNDFECFLMSLRKKDGKSPGKSVYSSMRSSLFHLYRLYDIQMPENYNSELKKFSKGLKRLLSGVNKKMVKVSLRER
ncbi:hypothetical protein JG688_00011640 [Phytophthora aleatoria]|uniref:Uncharacterized protein n=1 Tax=Phytophthora aleatoria TaxID=2496075 RepID=A0A8J5M0S4_9STRA|nr:hypothetical protein JG688_00011640 [Phytophthora aleatoria]